MRFRTLTLASLAAALTIACGDPYGTPVATGENLVFDTLTLEALSFTPPGSIRASGFSIGGDTHVVRTDGSTDYDFVYDIDSVLGPVFVPGQLTGVYAPAATNPGLQRTTTPFDSIKIAPSNGYKVDQKFAVDSGDVFLVRGSSFHCSGGLANYAKVEVRSIDPVARTVTFRSLLDPSCGFRGLETGTPQN
jgi:hypothetical protein